MTHFRVLQRSYASFREFYFIPVSCSHFLSKLFSQIYLFVLTSGGIGEVGTITHSNILAWRIPYTWSQQAMVHGVADWSNWACTHALRWWSKTGQIVISLPEVSSVMCIHTAGERLNQPLLKVSFKITTKFEICMACLTFIIKIIIFLKSNFVLFYPSRWKSTRSLASRTSYLKDEGENE